MTTSAHTANDPVLVSIVIPNFNGAEYLGRTLTSVAALTYSPIEVIVVDGASTDDSIRVIRDWEKTLPMRWISETDSGQAEAINKGFRMASGAIMGWINSDDMLTPTAAALAAARFSADSDLDFVWGFCLVVDADDRPLNIQNPFVREDLGLLRKHRNFVPQPGSWFSRRLVERYGPLSENLHYLFDYDFFLRFAGQVRTEFIPEVMAHFRIHETSKSGSQEHRFLSEEPTVFRAHGGKWLSPFWLNYLRYRFFEMPVQRAKEPLRRIVRRVLGLPAGARIRS